MGSLPVISEDESLCRSHLQFDGRLRNGNHHRHTYQYSLYFHGLSLIGRLGFLHHWYYWFPPHNQLLAGMDFPWHRSQISQGHSRFGLHCFFNGK